MWFWWVMLFCDLLIPVTMLIGGRAMWKHCPNSINGLFGYRTHRSMKNMPMITADAFGGSWDYGCLFHRF